MRFPPFDFFTKEQGAALSIIYASGSPSLSASPRLYKYLWQVFSRPLPYEGDAFFEHVPTSEVKRRVVVAGSKAARSRGRR
jgi:hypothetical protein